MTDEERAAKAARAKALLKKRQQQKKGGAAVSISGTHSPSASIPRSRTSSPAPYAPDSGSVISTAEDSLASPPPPSTPDVALEIPAAQAPPKSGLSESSRPRNGSATTSAHFEDENTKLLQDQRQTISLLVSEKTALTEALECFEGVDSRLRDVQAELEGKSQELLRLQMNLSRIEEERNHLLGQAKETESQNATLTSKLREQERELHSSRTETERFRSQLQDNERRTRELEEQLQNDDRVEILETKIKNTQDRAEEVAFQLSRLKQAHDKLKVEHEGLQNELRLNSTAEDELKRQVASMKDSLQRSEDNLSRISFERDALATEKASIFAELQSRQTSIADLRNESSRKSAELAAAMQQIDHSQQELRLALRRAEDAESAQRDLQEEGTGLIHSLEEMRPKIVELTGTKLELLEKLEQLDNTLNQRDSAISELEVELDSAHVSFEKARSECERLEREREKEKSEAEAGQSEMQKVYNDLQAKLDGAFAATREIEVDRSKQRQGAARLQEEVDRLRAVGKVRQEEIDSLRSQVDEQAKAGDDEQMLVEELQQEIEALRAEVATKEDEISSLQQSGKSSSPLPSSQNLDDEVKSAAAQQLELEVSTAQSTIRNLETSMYDAEARYLSLEKHVATIEDELSHLRITAKRQKPGYGSRDSGTIPRSDDLHRSSFASQRSDSASRLPATALIDESLPTATRHQRHISLAMLQARMYSEAEAASTHVATLKSPKRTAIGHVHSSISSLDSSMLSLRWPQFIDESHVFWCATCKGDLIVL